MGKGNTEERERKGLSWPIAVFLDTNILESLPESLESGELSSLVSEADRVFVPDVVAREWVSHRIEGARNSIAGAQKAMRHVQQYCDQWIKVEIGSAKEVLGNVTRESVKRLRAAKLRILRPPKLDTRNLTRRATRKIPPFKDRGRGFKDELVVLSMLEFFRSGSFKSGVLVSKDCDFGKDLGSRFAPLDVEVVVESSLSDALNRINQSLDDAVKKLREKRNSAALELVRTHWGDISSHIIASAREEGIPELVILGYFSSRKGIPERATFKRLVGVEPKTISHVSVGPEHPSSGRALITIVVTCDITAEVETCDWGTGLLGSTLTLEEKPPSLEFLKRQRRTLTVERPLRVEASAVEDEMGQWSDLEIFEDKNEYYHIRDEIREANRDFNPGAPDPPA